MFGPEAYKMKDLLEKYCRNIYPEINKVSTVPVGMLKFIATIKRDNKLKGIAEMFGYFEKANELGDAAETNALLGKPEITFEKWLTWKD